MKWKIIADSGYKTPSIAKFLLEKEITPVFPYTRPRGKRGFLRPRDFVYDEHFDCYLCPENHVLTYRTTTREGYREYKSNPKICKTCPLLAICTESRQHQKVVVRHIWKDALEVCEDIRHQSGMKERYQHRKETIERLFGTAKEYHNLRYTREKGKSKMEDKVGLTLACLNIKKLVKMLSLHCQFGMADPVSLKKQQLMLKKTLNLITNISWRLVLRIVPARALSVVS